MAKFQQVNVAVTVMYCGDRLLLIYNPEWGAFTFPMTKIREQPFGLLDKITQREAGSDAAYRNVAEVFGFSTIGEAGLLCDVPQLQQSDRSGKVQHYNFQVFGYPVENTDETPFARCTVGQWLTVDAILNPNRRPISRTARSLVRELQNAAIDPRSPDRDGALPPRSGVRGVQSSVALIQRTGKKTKEWLLQYNEHWNRYFLPGGRIKEDQSPEDCLTQNLKKDLGLDPTAQSDAYTITGRQPLTFRAWSTSSWKQTDYDMTVFDVALSEKSMEHFPSSKKSSKDKHPKGINPYVWVDAHEVRGECCENERWISPTVRRILREMGQIVD